MSIENVKKLELCKKLLHESLEIRSAEGESMFWEGHNLMEELVKTKDTEVLYGLFDLFTNENENGVCETLENEIFDNFTMEQIIEALSKKFSTLIINNEMRSEGFALACLNTGYFNDFRKIFNKAKPENSDKFLSGLSDWSDGNYLEEISILREDMKKW